MSTPNKGSTGRRGNGSARGLTIFVNYRRDDSGGQAQALAHGLKQRFGDHNVYFDVDQRAGIDWLAEIESKGASARVFLALIGPAWLASLKSRAQRGLEDYVLAEIEWALREWSGAVVPVLLDAQMPPPQLLPRSIRNLSRNEPVRLRRMSFESDLTQLIVGLEEMAAP
jgi:hypothetical protein